MIHKVKEGLHFFPVLLDVPELIDDDCQQACKNDPLSALKNDLSGRGFK